MRLSQIKHGFNKVLAVCTEYPRDTYNEIFFEYFLHGFFAVEFCLSVDILRSFFIFRFIKIISISWKYVIRTDINHLCIYIFADFSKLSRRIGIDRTAKFRLVFRFIHCCISGTVNYGIRSIIFHERFHFFRISQRKILSRCTDTFNISFLQFFDYIITELPRIACN